MTNWQEIDRADVRPNDMIRRTEVSIGTGLSAASHGCVTTYELDLDSRRPTVPVGTAGTATVRGAVGVRVIRCGGDGEGVTPFWLSAEFVHSDRVHPDDRVTNFKADTLLTEEAAEKIRAEERGRLVSRLQAAGTIGKTPSGQLAKGDRDFYETDPIRRADIEIGCGDQVRETLIDWLQGGAR